MSQEKLGKIETHKQNTDTEVLKGGGKYVERWDVGVVNSYGAAVHINMS